MVQSKVPQAVAGKRLLITVYTVRRRPTELSASIADDAMQLSIICSCSLQHRFTSPRAFAHGSKRVQVHGQHLDPPTHLCSQLLCTLFYTLTVSFREDKIAPVTLCQCPRSHEAKA